jgi:hypothetical protein
MSNHTDFILLPNTGILKDAVAASVGIGNGIETYSLYDYIMQSVFLKMTGAQEQKMKCICWELATYDYEYRYERYTKKTLGECSSYDDKKTIYRDLIEQIKKTTPSFNVVDHIPKEKILRTTISEVRSVFENSNMSIWGQKSFHEFRHHSNLIEVEHFIAKIDKKSNETKLFENGLQKKYDALYRHRNRCAHNTQSYQQNLPTLKTLAQEDYRYENYFVWFAILVLIDKIFIELYKKYLEGLESN